jgi:hypothetical protein
MKWIKLGVVFCPENNFPWMKTHAANPVAESLGGSFFRIHFTCRDELNRSSISWLELDMKYPFKILKISEKPTISPGLTGSFDDSGTSMGWLTTLNGRRFLYYLGWNLGVTVPFRNMIGLAIAEPGQEEFVKYSRAPLLDRSNDDPFCLSYPGILIENGLWRMWYGSNLSWGPHPEDMSHVTKYAESKDGIHWDRKNIITVPLKTIGEYAISKPCVVKENGICKMWYSYRGAKYRIGYAESTDGFHWTRMDDSVGISVSQTGWDSEMIEYAYVFQALGNKYMLYNGNGYGKTGFGLAVLEKG